MRRIKIFLKWFIAIVWSHIIVLSDSLSPIAIGFMGVAASRLVDDPYGKVIMGVLGSILGFWLLHTAAEIMILVSMFQIKMLLERYCFHFERQLEGAPIIT